MILVRDLKYSVRFSLNNVRCRTDDSLCLNHATDKDLAMIGGINGACCPVPKRTSASMGPPVKQSEDWGRRAETSSTGGLRQHTVRRHQMTLGTILLIVVVLMLIGAIPSWPHSRSWGYGPSGGIGLVLVILIVLLLMGRI